MGKKLYVGNLPYKVTNQNLEDMFTPFGTVESAQVIMDRSSGQSKGFGFVEMSSQDEANAAIEKLNGSTFENRALTVNEAKPPAAKDSRGGFGGGGGGRGGRDFGSGSYGKQRY